MPLITVSGLWHTAESQAEGFWGRGGGRQVKVTIMVGGGLPEGPPLSISRRLSGKAAMGDAWSNAPGVILGSG